MRNVRADLSEAVRKQEALELRVDEEERGGESAEARVDSEQAARAAAESELLSIREELKGQITAVEEGQAQWVRLEAKLEKEKIGRRAAEAERDALCKLDTLGVELRSKDSSYVGMQKLLLLEHRADDQTEKFTSDY